MVPALVGLLLVATAAQLRQTLRFQEIAKCARAVRPSCLTDARALQLTAGAPPIDANTVRQHRKLSTDGGRASSPAGEFNHYRKP